MAIPNMNASQHDPADLKQKSSMKAVDWYNLHVRKEGEKVLSEEEYNKMILKDKINKDATT